jgi:hypothetical protein|tara:strand:+ start:359 stop:5191 length:4833 start_codon:yes stop_codon:yes gene_type:complete
MGLQFSKSTKTVLDPNANNPDYQIDPITGKYVLKKLPVVVDQSSRIKTTTPPVFDQSDRSTTEGTGDKVPYVNPQADRGNKPPKTAPPKPEEVSGVPAVTTPTTGFDDTKTGTGRSTETGGVNKNTDTEPITVPPVNPDTMSNAPPPVVVKPDPVVVDDDPYADPPGREDDDPGPNYNPQFQQTDTPPATTPPAVDTTPLSEKDQLVEDIRAAEKTGRTPDPVKVARLEQLTTVEAINYEFPSVENGGVTWVGGESEWGNRPAFPSTAPERNTSIGSMPLRVAYADGRVLVGDATLFGGPDGEEPYFMYDRFLTEAEYNKEVADIKSQQQGDKQADTMFNKPGEPEVPAGTQAYNSFQQKIQSAISSGQLGGLPSKDEIRADRFLNGDQKTALLNMYPKPPVAETPAVDTSVPLDDTVIPSTGESTEGEADVVPDKVQRTSLNTADLQGWTKRASAGEVNIDEIKGLNLTPFQENSLISSYNTGVTNRAAAEQLALENQTAEEQRIADEAEEARIRQEAADEQQRKQDELDAAADADEQRKITARQGLVQGFKDSLLADPDFVVNMDQLRGSDPTAADELQYWMETSSEYLKAVKDAGLSGEGKTPDKPTLTSTGVVVNGDTDATDTTEDPEAPILTADGVVLPTDSTPEAPILTAEGVDLPGDTEVDETNEAFLSRMPAVPANLDNIDAFNWLADQGVTAEDAQKWFDWAKSTGRAAAYDPERPTEYDDPPKDEAADANLEQYATITPDLDPEKIRSLVEDFKFDTASVVRAGELLKSDGQDAYDGYVEAIQRGEGPAWEANYKELMDASDDGVDNAEDDDEIDSIYVVGSPEYEAAVAAVSIEDLILRIPEPPTDLDAMGKFFWLASQVDDAGNPLLTATEAQAYYEWSKKQQEDIDKNTSLDGKGGLGDASDPSNLESIQTTIADEIEKVVKDMGFNSEEYKTSQTTAIDARYEDARVRLGRQFAIDPGGTKTGRAQRAFETIENQRIQDLATLDTEVQDRLQAARDSTITNLVNAFSSITTGKMAEDQLDEQERQFNTELRESVRQFNNDIALRLKEFGLDETQIEAAIAKINSDMVNNTRAISAEISQAWADITGDVGVPGGVISLEDLGIPESEWSMFPYLPASDDMKDTIKMSFEAMLGRSITDDEMTNLMSNGRIKVDDNMPTQRAREFAATITQQNMDRISQYDAIAESNGLDRDKFTDAKERADREWSRINLEVAKEFGLDDNTFRNSMWDLDQRLSKIFFNEDYTEVERDKQRRNAINDVSRLYFPDEQGSFLQAKDQYDILYGDRERAVAAAFGMDANTFARANKQADTQESRMLNVWSSLLADVETETMDADSEWRKKYEEEMAGDTGKIQGAWDKLREMPWYTPGIGLFNAVFPTRPRDTTSIDFTWDGEYNQTWLTGIGGSISQVEGMDQIFQRLNPDPVFFDTSTSELTVVPFGTPGAEPQGADPGAEPAILRIDPDEAVTLFLDKASQSDIDNINEAFSVSLPPGALHNENTLKRNLKSYFTAVRDAPEGAGIRPFDVSYTPGDWFGRLDPTIQTGIMSLLGTTNFSPERAAGGTSALSSIGALLGTGLGAYYSGGDPATTKATSDAGAAILS